MLPYFRSQKTVISYVIRVIIGSENGPTCFIVLSVRRRPVRQTAQMREDFSSAQNGTKGPLWQRNCIAHYSSISDLSVDSHVCKYTCQNDRLSYKFSKYFKYSKRIANVHSACMILDIGPSV